MSKGFAPILILVGVLVIIATVGGAYFLGKQATPKTSQPQNSIGTSQTSQPTKQSTVTAQPSPAPTEVVSAQEVINFKQNPSWLTYTDNKAKFSVQYGAKGKISSSEEGKEVRFLSCTSDPKLTNGKDELCLQGFSIQVFDDYDGDSRREWLLKKNPSLKTYELSYEEVIVSGVSSLIVFADDPASMSFTYVLMPKNNKMYQLFNSGGKKNRDRVKEILSTFKFTQ